MYKKFCDRGKYRVLWKHGGQAWMEEDWGEISRQAFIRGGAKEFGAA